MGSVLDDISVAILGLTLVRGLPWMGLMVGPLRGGKVVVSLTGWVGFDAEGGYRVVVVFHEEEDKRENISLQ